MEYNKEELELLEAIENGDVEKVAFDNEAIKTMALDTSEYLKQKKQISINIKVADLDFVKQRANDIGISYQNIIQALIHNYRTGKLNLQL
jgi:predicted DNA binding CopG/RHH family protein